MILWKKHSDWPDVRSTVNTKLTYRVPMAAVPGSTAAIDVNRNRAARLPDLFRVFGEIHTLSVFNPEIPSTL